MPEIQYLVATQGADGSITSIREVEEILFCSECKLIACACVAKNRHSQNCGFLAAVTSPIAIACEHGFDVCPDCDPCTCGVGIVTEDFSDIKVRELA